MKSIFEKMIGVRVSCDYAWDDEGIMHIGERRDVVAYAGGDFKGKCIIFLHGNGETAISEKYLFDQLNERDESANLEAKALSTDKPRSILETVCSFANEPGLGGGVILLGARENPAADEDGILYLPEGLDDPDKAQLDLATQCASVFNIVVRPQITVETVRGRAMLKIYWLAD